MTEQHHTRRRVAYGSNEWQYGDLWVPKGPDRSVWPTVVLYHGGFWRAPYTSELMDHLAVDLVARGWAVWNVEYRRVGPGGGGGGWPATFDDARAALEAIGEMPEVDPTSVVTCGHSAGGHLSLWSAWDAARGERAVVPRLSIALSGVVDLTTAVRWNLGAGAVVDLMGEPPEGADERYRQVDFARSLPLGVAQLVLHAADDTVVPAQLSAGYAAAAASAGDDVEHVVVSGDHMSVIDPGAPAWAVVVDRLSHLG